MFHLIGSLLKFGAQVALSTPEGRHHAANAVHSVRRTVLGVTDRDEVENLARQQRDLVIKYTAINERLVELIILPWNERARKAVPLADPLEAAARDALPYILMSIALEADVPGEWWCDFGETGSDERICELVFSLSDEELRRRLQSWREILPENSSLAAELRSAAPAFLQKLPKARLEMAEESTG